MTTWSEAPGLGTLARIATRLARDGHFGSEIRDRVYSLGGYTRGEQRKPIRPYLLTMKLVSGYDGRSALAGRKSYKHFEYRYDGCESHMLVSGGTVDSRKGLLLVML
jgi:hypothetical protein